ncbi:MAG: carboxypeptidase regulatory-like domain-containing protein [Planctomycetes bacterium]|nr:carboxypeptidase regulatory-like domain-containing protein [Planctomycetota bacterium]
MRKWLFIFVAIGLVLALVWLLSRRDALRGPAAIAVVEGPDTTSLPALELTPPDAADKSTVRESVPAEVASAAPAPTPAAVATDEAEIRGRFLLPNGAAAVGARVALSGAIGNQERELRFGAPQDWKNIEVETDGDGRFSIRFDPPRAFQFFMKGSLANYCGVSWRWSEIEPKKLVDVGEVTLVRGGSIRGRIVDAKGRALKSGWTVYAEAGNRDFASGTDQTRVMVSPDAVSGEYLLAGVPPGTVGLKAYSRIANWIHGPDVVVREGEETLADIAYTGPDLTNRVTVSVSTSPFHLFGFGEFDIFLSGSGIAERKAQKVPGSSQSFAFEDVPPGQYRVEIRDPRFEPWSKDGVEPGTAVSAKLKGSAALVLQVVDDVTNAPIPRYALDIRYENTRSSPNAFRVLDAKVEPPADGFFAGIVPAEATAIVRVEGYSSCEVPLDVLAPNEQRAITARLVRATKLLGRVVSGPERTPIEHAKVALTPVRPRSDPRVTWRNDMDPDAKNTESDASGRFSIDNLSVGEFTVRASLNTLFSVEETVTIAQSTTPPEIELQLPARAWLVGRLIAPEGAPLAAMKVSAAPVLDPKANPNARRFMLFGKDDVSSPIAADGSFRVGPIPPGEAIVSVLLPELKRATSRSGWSSSPGASIELGRVELPANVETRRDFELGANCPGTLTFQLSVDALPASEYSVVIENAANGQAAGYVELDSAGKGRSGPVLPGSYTFGLVAASGSASFPLHQTSDLGPNQTVHVVLALQLFTATLHILDVQDGSPLAGQQIVFTPDVPDARHHVALQTDEEGRVTAKLPVGRYRVTAGYGSFGPAGSEAVTVDWSATGAFPAEVRIKRSARK